MKILIVDDDEALRSLLAKELGKSGLSKFDQQGCEPRHGKTRCPG